MNSFRWNVDKLFFGCFTLEVIMAASKFPKRSNSSERRKNIHLGGDIPAPKLDGVNNGRNANTPTNRSAENNSTRKPVDKSNALPPVVNKAAPSLPNLGASRPQSGNRSNVRRPSNLKMPKSKLGLGAPPMGEVEEVVDVDFSSLGVDGLVALEEWTDDDSTDTYRGLGAEAPRANEVGIDSKKGTTKKKKKRIQLTERDVSILRLLAKYKFGYRAQVEAYCERQDLSRRLTQLGENGLLRSEKITQNQSVWTPTKAGMEVANIEVPILSNGQITPTTIAHTIGLLNLGIGFEKGSAINNFSSDPSWPYKWRMEPTRDQMSFTLEEGETVVTERMILRSWNRMKDLYNEQELRHMWKTAMNWVPKRPGDAYGFGPETEEGNEWMFRFPAEYGAHVPDMVLVRPRNSDGSSRHVGIELELTSKPIPEWKRILSAFRGNPMFRTVVYFTHKRTINNGLTEVNRKHVGLKERDELFVMKYVPATGNLPFWG